MQSKIHADPHVFVDLRDEWHALAQKDPAATVFHLPEYLGIWWEEFGRDKHCELRAMELRKEDGSLCGVAALAEYADGVVRFIGDPDVTDYLGPISCPEDRQAVASAVFAEALRLAGNSPIELHCLASDSGWPDAYEQAAKDAGVLVTISEQDACPRVSLEGGGEGYLGRLTGKLRHEIRRKERRLREAGELATRVAMPDTIDADLELFLGFTRDRGDEKSEFFEHEARASFFSALGAAFLNHGLMRVVVLELDGTPVAVEVGFAFGDSWALYNMSFDSSRPELAPGMVLVGETIRLAAQEGCHTFDFLRGREPYKYRFGAADVPLLQVEIQH